ncbi:kinase-like protein [Fomitiporia mediterranea MF3/22]|uniref:kinase-like protein n=1 Tax=Fomitiporia mediterranea (strain MF3/22) TaxID=694068 RepID=UPI00044088AD|nr:kinase-like protein [Fomitiporia mediterranea MF3/22]EJC99013.1 kinase-like protein [Fomitiporia mediterranea MF3/22]
MSSRRARTILYLPKSGTQSLPISHGRNGDGDIVYEFVREAKAEDIEELTFTEEPLGVSARHGFGYLQVEFGDRIGPDGRYEILRKLGWGGCSSVWLAKDTKENNFVAIKALTGYETHRWKRHAQNEDSVIRELSKDKRTSETYCLTQNDRFTHPGKEASDGEHICIVTDPLGPSLGDYKRKRMRFTKPLIKKISSDILKGLTYMHGLRIAHTDLKPENVLMDLGRGSTAFDIDSFIKNEPARRHHKEKSQGGKPVSAAVSQPFPLPSPEDCLSRNYVITDFGSAQHVNDKKTNHIMPPDLRAPEVILGLQWDEKVDIWAFGCLVFEFVNNQRLIRVDTAAAAFNDKKFGNHVLYQILAITRDRLPRNTIESSESAKEYLDPNTGWLKDQRGRPEVEIMLSDILKGIGALKKPEDIVGCETLLRKCLRLDRKDRYSARDILIDKDSWLKSET